MGFFDRGADMLERKALLIVALLWVLAAAVIAEAPKVIKAVPDNGERNVDPGLREIRVTFDQPMDTGGASFVGGGPTFPKLRGGPQWVDDRTCILPVQLDPNHEYWTSVNSGRFTNFRSKSGEIAGVYPIGFRTAARASTRPALTREENRRAIELLRNAIDKEYAYRDLRKVDWARAFSEHAAKLEAARTPKEFATEAGKMLAAAQDLHIWLDVDGELVGSFMRRVDANFRLAAVRKLVPKLTRHSGSVYSGRFDDGIGYVLIASWANDQEQGVGAAMQALKDSGAAGRIIIDVRPNSGGAEPLAQRFAGCFVDEAKVYARHVVIENGQSGRPWERIVEPNKDAPAFRGKVLVLMGPANMSSCESFLLMMKQVKDCTLVGQRSWGSSGNPQPHYLRNGVTVFLPCWKDLRLDGTCIEGEGIAPDVEVKMSTGELADGDPVLEAALKLLRAK